MEQGGGAGGRAGILGLRGLGRVRWYEERMLEVWQEYWVARCSSDMVGWFKGGAGVVREEV